MRIEEPIKLICVKNDLTQAEIARRLGVSSQAFSQKIKRGTFSVSDLDNIAIVTGCKLECNFILPSGEKIPLL